MKLRRRKGYDPRQLEFDFRPTSPWQVLDFTDSGGQTTHYTLVPYTVSGTITCTAILRARAEIETWSTW